LKEQLTVCLLTRKELYSITYIEKNNAVEKTLRIKLMVQSAETNTANYN